MRQSYYFKFVNWKNWGVCVIEENKVFNFNYFNCSKKKTILRKRKGIKKLTCKVTVIYTVIKALTSLSLKKRQNHLESMSFMFGYSMKRNLLIGDQGI